MSDTRRPDPSRPDASKHDPSKPDASRPDPLKRTPPTIDLKAEVVKKDEPAPAKTTVAGTPSAPVSKAPETKPDAAPKSATAPTAQASGASAPAKSDAKPGGSPATPAASAASATVPASKPVESPKPAPAAAASAVGQAKPVETPKPSDTKPGAPTAGAAASAVAATTAASAVKDPKNASTASATSVPSGASAKPNAAKSVETGLGDRPEARTTTAAPRTSGTTTTTAAPASSAPRGGAGAVLTAGFVGGLLGTVLAIGLPRMLPFPPERGVEDRIAAMERQVAAIPKSQGDVGPRISALETSVKQAADDARAAEAAAEAAANRPAGAQGPDQETRSGLQTLTGQMRDATAKTAANASALDTLGRTTSERFTAMAKDSETLATHVKSLQADVAALRTSGATIDTRMGEADKRLASVTEGLGRVSTDLAKLSPAAIQAGLRVVVSGRLDDALRAGAPLGPAIATLAKLGTDAPSLAPLRPFAEVAAPSPAALAAEFKPIATALTTEPARPDDSWMDKGRRVLGKVVSIQPVGEGGEDTPSLVSRIDASLSRGDVAAAKAAFDQLPADKKNQASAFGEKLANRAAADEASRRIGAQSLATLDAATR